MYTDFEAGSKTYKLQLTTRAIVDFEQKYNMNPILLFGKDGKSIPTVEQMVFILSVSLKKHQKELTLNDAYDIFDAFLEDGHQVMDFIIILVRLFKDSGILKEPEKN